MREAALDELVDLVGRQMAGIPLDGLEDRLPLFCVADVHRKVPDGRILVRLPGIVNKTAGWRQTAERSNPNPTLAAHRTAAFSRSGHEENVKQSCGQHCANKGVKLLSDILFYIRK